MTGHKKFDRRPICDCLAYSFPHRIGGRCTGSTFTEFYFQNIKSECEICNCNTGYHCDVSTGQESIKDAECYSAAKHYRPGGHLQITLIEPER